MEDIARGVRRACLIASAIAAVSCTRGTPAGFADGDYWTIPLVGTLEEGQLIVPALVSGKGPFLFAIDTDAHVSTVDSDLVQEIGARTGAGPDLLDETNIGRERFYAEILEWQLGTLTVKNKPAQIVSAHAFDVEGRRIHGVIGRDILADSYVLGFDRHLGELTLTARARFEAPPGAQRVAFRALASQLERVEVVPPARKLVDAMVDGERFALHLDFGSTASQLREPSWAKAKLVESPVAGNVVDEVGTPRAVAKQGVAAEVALGAAIARDVAFVPYDDKRWPAHALAGTLGLDFFKAFAVDVDWDGATLYLRPRHALDDVTARIGRWHSKTLSGCARTGCVTISLIDPVASRPEAARPATHPGIVVSIVREPETRLLDLEVVVAVTAADGATALPWLIVNLPAGVERVLGHLPPEYAGATTTVLDASPFPRECPQVEHGDEEGASEPSAPRGCVDRLRPPVVSSP